MKLRSSVRALFLVAACSLAATLALPGAAKAFDDPFQRQLIFYNDSPITIYPVIQAPEEKNCHGTHSSRRIFVNQGTKGAGIPMGGTVKLRLPKGMPCWYNAARVFIFTANIESFEAALDPNLNQRTVPDNITWNPPLCDGAANTCWSGYGNADYGRDAPNQLLEYTIISQNPATGDAFPDPNNPNGIPFVDFDVSYVDDAYLPVAMQIKDGGATAYMGTAISYADFNTRTTRFLVTAQRRTQWSEYAAYNEVNFPNAVFKNLVTRTDRVPSGQILIQESLTGGTSSLYTPTFDGPAACSATPACSNLAGNCCPADDGQFLSCCDTRAWMIENTSKKPGGGFTSTSLVALTARWTKWVNEALCDDLNALAPYPSDLPAFDKALFCRNFRRSVKLVWNFFTSAPECKGISGPEKDQCITAAIIGFKSKEEGPVNGSVQSLQRSVPFGDINQGDPLYQNDPFLHYWAPYGSVFNLNPFPFYVHNNLEALGAYAFSIDDRYGNFGGRGSGMIVDVGGSRGLNNKDQYSPYRQFRAAWGPGWDHVTVCGREIIMPGKIGTNASFAFWSDGSKTTSCDVILYSKKDNSFFVKYRLGVETKDVTDIYTGLPEKVDSLTIPDPLYCANNSSPTLVAAGKCTGNLSFPTTGDESYASLTDAEKPRVTLNIPALQ
jgi:hypothetical protein